MARTVSGRPAPPVDIRTHCADIFDRCLDDEDRSRRLHEFVDPILVSALVLVCVGALVGALLFLGAVGLLIAGLLVPHAPLWMPVAGGATSSILVLAAGLLRRRLVRVWRSFRLARRSGSR